MAKIKMAKIKMAKIKMTKKNILKNKKSQIIGQIFVYILVIVVVGGIILVGYWAIKSLLQKSCDVSQISFKVDLEKMLSKSNTYGSVSTLSLSVPCDYPQVCFVDASKIGNASFTCSANKIIEGSVKDKQRMNIFLSNKEKTYPIGFSNYIVLETPNSCLCINAINSRFYFLLKGQGPTTLLKNGSPNGYGT